VSSVPVAVAVAVVRLAPPVPARVVRPAPVLQAVRAAVPVGLQARGAAPVRSAVAAVQRAAQA
jgi:hypothetical protein